MVEKITKKKDFVQLEFLARNLSNNEVFDTNIKSEAEKLKLDIKDKPLIVCIGEGMVVKGLDKALEGKEIGKKYSIKLFPDEAFGKRHKELVRLLPMKIFEQQKVYPQPGMVFALDNNLVKIVSVSGGRVLVDFNNPLAGKEIEYEFTIKKIIEDNKEKASALINALIGFDIPFELDEKNKKIIFKDIKLTSIINIIKDKFSDILGYDIEILEKAEKKEEAKKEEKLEKKEEKK